MNQIKLPVARATRNASKASPDATATLTRRYAAALSQRAREGLALAWRWGFPVGCRFCGNEEALLE